MADKSDIVNDNNPEKNNTENPTIAEIKQIQRNGAKDNISESFRADTNPTALENKPTTYYWNDSRVSRSKEEENARNTKTEEAAGDNGTPTPTSGRSCVQGSGGVEGVETFEDVLEIIGTLGRWNVTIFIACSIVPLVNSIVSMNYEFLGVTPDYWCHVGPLVEANWTKEQIFHLAIPNVDSSNGSEYERCKMFNYNYSMAADLGYEWSMEHLDELAVNNDSSPINCGTRDFDRSVYTSTVVTEWDLVCERRALYPTTQAACQLGNVLGAPICGFLANKYGRRPVILSTTVIFLVAGVGAALSPWLSFLVAMRIIQTGVSLGTYMSCFVTLMEVSTPSQRSTVGNLFAIPYAFGYMLVPAFAYAVRPWRWLQATYTLPGVILLSYFWILPESPRWLIMNGQGERALSIISSAAKVNHRPLPPSDTLLVSLKAMQSQREEKVGKNSVLKVIVSNVKYAFSLLIQSELRVKALISYFCWFAIAFVYYGVSLNADNMSVNPYLYFFLGGIIEMVSYGILLFMMIFMKRKTTLVCLCLLCTLTISTIAILLRVSDRVSTGITLFLSLAGKFGATAGYQFAYIYTAELFPTKYRSLAIGECGIMSNMGGMVAPYMNDLLGPLISWAPSAVFALVSVLTACLALILPETKGTKLVEEKNQDQNDLRRSDSSRTEGKDNFAFESND